MAPDTWRCECGYTNLRAKVCMVCRRPRTAVPAEDDAQRGFAPPPPEPKKRRPAR